MTITARRITLALAASLTAATVCAGLAGVAAAHQVRSDGSTPSPAPTSTVNPNGSHWT